MSNGITSLVKPVSYEETLASLPPRRSPYEAFSYLLQPPSVRDRAPAQPAPMPPIEIAPMPMPTDPIAGQPMPTQPPPSDPITGQPMPTQPSPSDPVATQPPPPARPPMQTDPTPTPDPMPVIPEAFDPTVPVVDPMQPERPDPIIDTKKTPTTLAELEAMLGYKWIKNEDTSPIRNTMYTDQDHLRNLARQYGIALPPDAPIDMTGFEDPPLDSTPPVGTTPPVNMPAPGTVINLPFGGSFTIPDDIQERIDAAKAEQAGTTPPPVTTPTTPSLPPVGTTIPLPFGGGLTVTQDMQDRINAAKAAVEAATTTTPRANIEPTTRGRRGVASSPMVGGRRGLMVKQAQDMQDRINEAMSQANANQSSTPMIEPPAGASGTIPEGAISEDLSRIPMGGRRGLMSREGIENLRKRVDEMRTPPPTPMIELPAGAPRTIPEGAISEDLSRLPQGFLVGEPRPDVSPDSPLGRMIAARKNYQDPSAPRLPQGIVAGGPRPDGIGGGGLLSRILDDSVPVVSPPSDDSLQRGIDNLRDIFGRASEGEDRSSGSEDMFSKLRDSLRPTDTRDPRRLPPTLPINVGQQRAPQLPMPRRLPTPVPNLPDFLQRDPNIFSRSQPIDERLEEVKRVIAEMQRGPTPKLPRRRIPINTDKLRRGRR
jgi:hypothetical protein